MGIQKLGRVSLSDFFLCFFLYNMNILVWYPLHLYIELAFYLLLNIVYIVIFNYIKSYICSEKVYKKQKYFCILNGEIVVEYFIF